MHKTHFCGMPWFTGRNSDCLMKMNSVIRFLPSYTYICLINIFCTCCSLQRMIFLKNKEWSTETFYLWRSIFLLSNVLNNLQQLLWWNDASKITLMWNQSAVLWQECIQLIMWWDFWEIRQLENCYGHFYIHLYSEEPNELLSPFGDCYL